MRIKTKILNMSLLSRHPEISVRVYVVGVNETVLSETNERSETSDNLSGITGIVCSPHC